MSNTTNKLENDMDNSVKALQKCYRRSKLDRFDKIVKTELENKIKTAKEKIEMYESKIRKLKEGLDSDIRTLKGVADFRGRATAWIKEIRANAPSLKSTLRLLLNNSTIMIGRQNMMMFSEFIVLCLKATAIHMIVNMLAMV